MSHSSLKQQEVKSFMKVVPKVWGKEIWIVNEPEYCAKFLHLNKNAQSSMHYHKTKKETFYALTGQVALHIDGKDYMLNPFSRPKTVLPKKQHQFWGISDAVILEISTHHSEDDVVRLSESRESVYK